MEENIIVDKILEMTTDNDTILKVAYLLIDSVSNDLWSNGYIKSMQYLDKTNDLLSDIIKYPERFEEDV